MKLTASNGCSSWPAVQKQVTVLPLPYGTYLPMVLH